MLDAAELRALAAIRAGRLRCEVEAVVAARDQVLLAGEVGHPEGMDDVGGGEQHAHRAADRHADFVRRLEAGIAIGDFPPPLMTAHLDGEDVAGGGGEAPRREEADKGQGGDHDHGRGHGGRHRDGEARAPRRARDRAAAGLRTARSGPGSRPAALTIRIEPDQPAEAVRPGGLADRAPIASPNSRRRRGTR